MLAVCGLAACWSTIEMMIWLGGVEPWYIEELLWALAIAAAGGAMFCSGVSIGRSLKRYNKYLAVVGNYEAMAVEQLCRTLGYSRDRVEKDLQKMIDKGYFGDEAYLNMELGVSLPQRPGGRGPETEAPAGGGGRGAAPQGDGGGLLRNPAEDPPGQRRHRGPGTLCQDRPAGDHHRQDLPGGGGGPEEARPDRYLPELLPAYYPEAVGLPTRSLRLPGVEGENLRQAKARIESTMDLIIKGFEHQLDELYKADAMDVDSDIRVMETMLERDTASVEKDFGLGEFAAEQKPEETE